jgi:hypothetical protein
VDDTATWAINPFSFVHGFIAWGDGDVLGEKMVPVTEPLPEVDPAPPQAKRGWEVQVGMSLKCMDGEDAGMEAKYSVTSVGGKRAVQKLALDIAAQVEKDQANPVPVVKLKKDHYTHKSYGRIFTPVFEIVKWIGLDGETAAKADDVPASDAPADGAVRRRRSA